ncbi:hypothetical protein [Arthrobacter sp. UYCu712]|uniref:hypothetical protein n=1 Tax=Arthrobacter sp. UYCu712 TaxID=3156340 RepID=UPI00339958B7
MSLPVWRRALLLAALLAGLTATPSAAQDAAQETAPCAKLAAGEVRFPAGDATRVVFVTATATTQNTVLITGCLRNPDGYSQEWQATGFIGENSFAPEGTLREGQYQSPTGSFSATEALGLANPGTRLTYHVVNPRSRWGGPGSASYNSYLEGGSSADENLWYWANQGTYAQATVINHNRPPDSPAVPGADYAIFFGAGNRVSAGCVSTTLEIATLVVRTLAPGDRFIMGVVSDVFQPDRASTAAAPPASSAPPAPPASSSGQEVRSSAPPSQAQGAPASDMGAPDFIPLGVLLFAAGGTAVFVFFVLRTNRHGRHS